MTSDDDNSDILVEFHRIDGRGQVGDQVFAQRILPKRDKLFVIYVSQKNLFIEACRMYFIDGNRLKTLLYSRKN